MVDQQIYPLTFTPVLRSYIWGGRRLQTLLGRTLPEGIIAESWEISGHPSGPTAADTGYWAGQTLPRIMAALGQQLAGRRAAWALERERFPLLVKLLDAHQDLSVQVHPDDAYAAAHAQGELGKTEMWYVLHADPGTEIILGTEPGTDARKLRAALAEHDLAPLLRHVPIQAGDAVAIPAGTVHALLAGAVVAEIQQNSDTTYRLYDWERLGQDGQPRPLHIDQALEVIDFGGPPRGVAIPRLLSKAPGLRRTELVRNDYFVVEEVTLDAGAEWQGACDGETLEIWGCVRGQTTAGWQGGAVSLPSVRFALLPAALGEYRVGAAEPATCLRVYLP